jgi:hypothetical protein
MGMKRTTLLGFFSLALVHGSACDLEDKSIGDDSASGETGDVSGTGTGESDDAGEAGDASHSGSSTDTAGGGDGCYGDTDCPDGLVCNAVEVCLPPPGCESDSDCDPVCYGECVEPDDATTCEMVQEDYVAEMAEAGACTSAEECGQTLTWGSCGCTRAPVVRLDHDIEQLESLWNTGTQMECLFTQGGGTCDCPEADGFACIDERCTWNYL